MSEDKKAPGPKPAHTGSGAEQTARDPNSMNADRDQRQMNDGNQANSARGRARNQDVLPGILGKQLKAAYSELLNAPVPDAITRLIKQLEDKEPTPPPADKPPREESGQ
jgi:Anti-sigma factor NepR